MNAFDQMCEALDEAQELVRQADKASERMARILKGRLRHVPSYILVEMKRELQQFDGSKKIWKETR